MNGVATKFFEIRDAGTFIPVITTLLISNQIEERYLLGSAGYDVQGYLSNSIPILVTRLNECLSANDPHEWGNRTMQIAHAHIEKHFNELESGAVIDVQYILGERLEPKTSRRLGGRFS